MTEIQTHYSHSLVNASPLNIPLNLQYELCDRMILPMLLSGSKVLGSGNNEIIERVHLKFSKYILKLMKTIATCMAYGELGRYPLEIQIKSRMIGY